MLARTEANSILGLGSCNEGYLPLVWPDSGTFFDTTIALPDDAVVDWLIKLLQLLYLMMRSLIDWSNKYSWRLHLTIAQPWTAPVFVLGHSWPTFSLSLPVQSSLFTLLWAEFFISSSVQNAKGVSVISKWPSHICTMNFPVLHLRILQV